MKYRRDNKGLNDRTKDFFFGRKDAKNVATPPVPNRLSQINQYTRVANKKELKENAAPIKKDLRNPNDKDVDVTVVEATVEEKSYEMFGDMVQPRQINEKEESSYYDFSMGQYVSENATGAENEETDHYGYEVDDDYQDQEGLNSTNQKFYNISNR